MVRASAWQCLSEQGGVLVDYDVNHASPMLLTVEPLVETEERGGEVIDTHSVMHKRLAEGNRVAVSRTLRLGSRSRRSQWRTYP